MKNASLLIALFCISLLSFGQDFPYQFSNVKSAEATAVKDQYRTGTCWSFATSSFIESELMRMGKGQQDISEMFSVRVTYPKKALNYIRYMGKTQFGPGSLSHDVINAIRDYGMVPEAVYSGIGYNADKHDHGEMDAILEAMMKALAEKGELSDRWDEAIDGVLDAYLGKYPAEFTYEGKKYTPASYRDAMGVKAADYVSLTSFTHHPFNQKFVLEVPDNFSQGSFYNLPLNDFMSAIDNALATGFTIAWDADVSEMGFSFRNGIAILPAENVSKADLFKSIVPEMKVTQENRQSAFNQLSTTDDHLMHITGTATDQNGVKYYLVKNSWGTGNDLDGYQYVSESYVKMKTIAVVLHKDGLGKELQKKMGI